MRRFTIISLLASLSLLFSSLAHSELSSAVSRPVLLLTQSVDSAGASTLTGKVGNLGYSNTGFGVSQAVTINSAQLPAPVTPPQLTAGASRDTVAQAATAWANATAPILADSIESYMNQYGLSSAWFVYEQRVNVPAAGGSGTAQLRLSWSLFEDAKGRVSYGAPRLEPLTSGDVRVLKVSYAAKAVAAGLPASFANANGGILNWQVLNSSLVPLSGANTSGSPNMNGAFDPPASGAVDNRSALRSLISTSAASLDVKRLLAQTGSTLAIVDYTYPPEPQYAPAAGTDSLCPAGATGSRCYAAVGSYNFTRREVFTACGATSRYENDVTYAFSVETITDRFIVDPASLEANGIQRFTDVKLGTSQAQSLTRNLSGAEVVSLTPASTLVLNPFDGSQLIPGSQLVGTVTLADVKRTDAPCAPVTASVSPSSHNVATTGTFTVTAGGGLPPYSYNWFPVADFAGGSISIGSPTGKTTTIARSGPSMGPAGGTVGYVDVRVTDSLGAQATARVTLTINADPPLQVDYAAGAKVSPVYGVYAAEGSCASAEGMCTASTTAAPIVISGGTGSYNIQWARLTGDVATVNQPSSAHTTFTRANPTQPTNGTPLRRSGLYRVTVYDGRSTVSKDLAVETLHTRTVLAEPLRADFVGPVIGCDQGSGCYPDPQVIVTGGVAPYTYSWSISKVPQANVIWMDLPHSHARIMGTWGNAYPALQIIFEAHVTVTDSAGNVAFTKMQTWRKMSN